MTRIGCVAVLAVLPLAGCGDAGPETAARMPSPGAQLCLRDVTATTNNPDVVLISETPTATGTTVIVGVGPQRAQWSCFAERDGTTSGISSLTDEGAL